jgi:hypothetical protein
MIGRGSSEESSAIRGVLRYFPTGTLRRSSSKKFIRNTTWFCGSCAPLASVAGIRATMRLPSDARSMFFEPLTAYELLLNARPARADLACENGACG